MALAGCGSEAPTGESGPGGCESGQLSLAEEGLSLMESAYQSGAGASLDVTQARQNYSAAGVNLAATQFQAQIALLNLLDSIGEEIVKKVGSVQ